MRHLGSMWIAVGLLAACGGDATDAGRGTGTLLVNATVSYEDGAAQPQVSVRRAGVEVTDATVRVDSGAGELLLNHVGGGVYRGSQAGWHGAYTLRVAAGPNGIDHLDGSIEAPVQPILTMPAPGVAFDPHLAANGVVELRWSGDRAMRIRVRTKEYDPGYVVDEGRLLVSGTYFVDSSQDVELDRQNSVDLAGGAPGSRLRAEIGSRTRLAILNPY